MNKVAKIILVQNTKQPGHKKLHKSSFSKMFKDAGLDVDIEERTDPVRYLKCLASLYPVYKVNKRVRSTIVNTSGVKFEIVRRFGKFQFCEATNLTMKRARVYYPRIVFYESFQPDLDDERSLLDKLSIHYGVFQDAGIATFATNEESAFEEILKMLELAKQRT